MKKLTAKEVVKNLKKTIKEGIEESVRADAENFYGHPSGDFGECDRKKYKAYVREEMKRKKEIFKAIDKADNIYQLSEICSDDGWKIREFFNAIITSLGYSKLDTRITDYWTLKLT